MAGTQVAGTQVEGVQADLEHHITIRKKGYQDHVISRIVFPDVDNKLPLVQLVDDTRSTAAYLAEMSIRTIPRESQIFVNSGIASDSDGALMSPTKSRPAIPASRPDST